MFVADILFVKKSLADPSSAGEWSVVHQLKEHPYPVGCLAWSLDDKILLTCSDNIIKLWNTKVYIYSVCRLDLLLTAEHTEWSTYGHPRQALGDGDRHFMVARWLRVYIWRFGSQDNHLGKCM